MMMNDFVKIETCNHNTYYVSINNIIAIHKESRSLILNGIAGLESIRIILSQECLDEIIKEIEK